MLVPAGFVGLWGWQRLVPDLLKLADRAVKSGDVGPVLAALHRLPVGSQPTAYHRVIGRLWNGYHREEAVQLAKDYATKHREAPTSQFWLRQFLQLEPEIATKYLEPEFLEAFHDPAVAARCGKAG